MAEAVRTFKFKNAEDIPESLSERFGFDENDHLVNINEKGEATQARKLGHAIVELALKGGLIEEEAPPQPSPEVALLLRRLDEIESQMDEMMAFIEGKSSDSDEISPAMQAKIDAMIEEKIRPLNDRINELETENKTLKDEKEQLQKELAEAKGETDDRKRVGGFGIGEKVALLADDNADEEEYETGYEVKRFTKKDDKDMIVIKNETDEEQIVEPGQLASEDELDLDGDDIEDSAFSPDDEVGLKADGKYIIGLKVVRVGEPDENGLRKVTVRDSKGRENTYIENRLSKREVIDDDLVVTDEPPSAQPIERKGYRRFTGGFGDFLVGRQVALHNGAYNLMDRRGRRVVVEEVDEASAMEYARSNERVGAIAAGALAVGAVVGILLYEFFEDKVFGHSHARTIRQTVTIPGSGGSAHHVNTANGSILLGGGIPAHGPHGSEHIDFFNSAAGHRRTGAILPHGLKLGHDSFGRDIILGTNKNPVVTADMLPNGIMKSNGTLTTEAVAQLRKLNYHVGYIPTRNVTGANNLYMSVVS